jgi:hypothetical protein
MQVQLLPVLHHKTALFGLSEHAVKFQNSNLNVFDAVSIILKNGNHIENICSAGRSISKELGIKFEKLNLKDQLSLSTLAMNLQAFKESQQLEVHRKKNDVEQYAGQFSNLEKFDSFKLGKWDLRQALLSIKSNTFSQKFESQHSSFSQLCSLTELALIACEGGLNYAYSVLSATDTDWMTFNNAQYLMGVGMGFLRERSGDRQEITELRQSFQHVYKNQLEILKRYAAVYPQGSGSNRILNLMIKCLDAVKSDFIDITPQQYITAASFAAATARSPDMEAALLKTAVDSYGTYKPQVFIHLNKQTSFIYNTLTELQIGCTHFLTHLPGTIEEKIVLLNMSIEPLFQTAADVNLGTGDSKADCISQKFKSIEKPQYSIERTDHFGKKHTRISYAH